MKININAAATIIAAAALLQGCSIFDGGNGKEKAPSYTEYDHDYVFTDDETGSFLRTIHVSPDGNDSGDGTEQSPYRTITKACSILQAGDKICVHEGIYNERIVINGVNGTAADPVVISAVSGDSVVIDGKSAGHLPEKSGLIEIKNSSYITVKGFKVQHSKSAGIYADNAGNIRIRLNFTYHSVSSGIGVWNSSHILIDGNEVVGANDDSYQENITVAQSDNFEVCSNHVHHGGPGTRGGEGIDTKHSNTGTVHNNIVHHLNRLGIYVDAWDTHTFNIRVYSNTVYENKSWGICLAAENGGLLENIHVYNNIAYGNYAIGIGVEGEDWGENAPHPMKDIYIYNNTSAFNGGKTSDWGVGIHIENHNADNVVIYNNIAAFNSSSQIEVESAPSNLSIKYNLIGYRYVDGGIFDWGTTDGANAVISDPLFVSADNKDFHLTENSPAIAHGLNQDYPELDYDGTLRNDGAVDIGAFEYIE